MESCSFTCDMLWSCEDHESVVERRSSKQTRRTERYEKTEKSVFLQIRAAAKSGGQ